MAKTYRVLGMTCGGCANAVSNAIQAAVPGATIEVNLEAKAVTVEGTEDNTVIKQAIEDAGFEYAGSA